MQASKPWRIYQAVYSWSRYIYWPADARKITDTWKKRRTIKKFAVWVVSLEFKGTEVKILGNFIWDFQPKQEIHTKNLAGAFERNRNVLKDNQHFEIRQKSAFGKTKLPHSIVAGAFKRKGNVLKGHQNFEIWQKSAFGKTKIHHSIVAGAFKRKGNVQKYKQNFGIWQKSAFGKTKLHHSIVRDSPQVKQKLRKLPKIQTKVEVLDRLKIFIVFFFILYSYRNI